MIYGPALLEYTTIGVCIIKHVEKIDKFCSKLVRLSKPVKVTNNKQDTLAYYLTDIITAATSFMGQTREY